jgi:hypothetical protein
MLWGFDGSGTNMLLFDSSVDLFKALVIWYTENTWFAIPPATAPGCTHRRLDLVLDKLALTMFSAHKVSQDWEFIEVAVFQALFML